ncbi:MAG: hypothetical protein NTV73_11715 [Hyphomicrobiales bacterium]|nr:hypothetical protein [Hyphomicrobiales bacterium]
MTEEEFERLKRRFGDAVADWPAPYRQQAAAFVAETGASRVDDLDRLILDAASAETNEAALTRRVLARIADDRKPAAARMAWRGWTLPAAASGFAALLMVATIAGYVAAGDGLGGASEGIDDALMAFALGDGGTDVFDGFGGEDGGEEQL